MKFCHCEELATKQSGDFYGIALSLTARTRWEIGLKTACVVTDGVVQGEEVAGPFPKTPPCGGIMVGGFCLARDGDKPILPGFVQRLRRL